MENQQSMQEQYLAVIKQIIEDNIDNEGFSVADLAREAGLSRSMLHRKLIRLTGKSATDLIREIRLAKALELLENDVGTVSEIAYRVGYSSPSYFNKVFRKTYGISAGEVKKKGRGNIPHLRVVKEPGVTGIDRSIRSGSKVITATNILLLIIVIVGAVALILGLTDKVSPFSGLPAWTIYLILAILVAGFIIAAILFWIYDIRPQGEMAKTKPADKFKPGDMPRSYNRWKIARYFSFLIIFGLILGVGILAYPKIFEYESFKKIAIPVWAVNEFGEREAHWVYKKDYLTRLALFPFENETTDSTANWVGWGIMEAVFEDQRQFSNMLIRWGGFSLLKDQINFARNGNYPHFLTGTYRMDGSMYEITTRLFQTSNGSSIQERTYEGDDFFSLIDSICIDVRNDLDISEIILEATTDLPVSAIMTDHPGAYESYIRGKYWFTLDEDAYSNLNNAITFDSTFALACLTFANICFNYEASHLSAVKSIEQAIRHRSNLSGYSYDRARSLHYLIKEDRENMIKFSEYLVEIRPGDYKLLENLCYNCLRLLLIDQAEELMVKLNALVPDHPFYQLWLAHIYMLSGNPSKAMKVLNELLVENPENVRAMLMLGQAYLHDKDLEAAEEIFTKAITLKPEHQKYWSYFLTHISFVRETENMEEQLESFTNKKKWQDGESTEQTFRINKQLCSIWGNQSGTFIYPVSDSVVFTVIYNGITSDFAKWSYIFSRQGKPVKVNFEQLSTSDRDFDPIWWIEDSLILRAKDLLAEGLPQEALTAFRSAFEENPEHFYLANYIQHLQLFTSPEYETLQSVFEEYEGFYGAVKFEIEQDHFYFRHNQGVIFELLPLSEDTFMVPSIYKLMIHMVKENGVVSGLKYFKRDGSEEFFPKTHELSPAKVID